MKPTQLRELSVEELRGKLADFKGELFNLRFQHATGQLDNPLRITLTVSPLTTRRVFALYLSFSASDKGALRYFVLTCEGAL